ncbi:MAG TPA: MFS transporter [Acidimicrobiales bacterium]|nr:MFS transporter [Acidimicrobiales bacterium]
MAAAFAVTTSGLLAVYLTGSLAVEVRHQLGIDESQLGVAVSAFFAASAACATVSGRLADRLGGRRVLRIALLPAFASLVVIGALVHAWWSLVVALLLAGVANGAIQPASNRYLARTVRAERQGLAFGVKQAAIPVATLVSGVAVPAVALTVGWRWAFLGSALLVVACGVAIPRRAPARRATPAAADGSTSGFDTASFPRWPLVVLAGGVGLGAAAGVALGSFFVVAATDTGIPQAQAGLLAALGSAASLVARLSLGHRADRRSSGHLRVVAAMLATGVVGYLLLVAAQPALVVPAAILAYGAGWGWAGLVNFATTQLYPAVPGRATAIVQVGASSGGALGPLVFGYVAAGAGFPIAWGLTAAWATGAAVLVLYGRHLALARLRAHPVAGPEG